MSSSNVPEEQAKVKAFDPLVLDRTVIAIPLLKDMQADLEHIQLIKEGFPDAICILAWARASEGSRYRLHTVRRSK